MSFASETTGFSPPGAASLTTVPKLEKDDLPPERFTDATDTAPLQLAGAKSQPSRPSLPAAAITAAPIERAELMALCMDVPQPPGLPNDMLITLAGLAFAGVPCTGTPAAQRMASTISEVAPPHLPNTRTGNTRALCATPATPLALLVRAAMIPATCVPCQELGARSNGSCGQ